MNAFVKCKSQVQDGFSNSEQKSFFSLIFFYNAQKVYQGALTLSIQVAQRCLSLDCVNFWFSQF